MVKELRVFLQRNRSGTGNNERIQILNAHLDDKAELLLENGLQEEILDFII